MTRKVLLITEDLNLKQFVEISAITLTKLNCQVELISFSVYDECKRISGDSNLDLILLDLELTNFPSDKYIDEIRNSENSKNKKIIAFAEIIDNKEKENIFKSGCDSIMTKDELKSALNNLLQY
jgi:DNA-binding response OmpR family regulator